MAQICPSITYGLEKHLLFDTSPIIYKIFTSSNSKSKTPLKRATGLRQTSNSSPHHSCLGLIALYNYYYLFLLLSL